MPKNFHAFLLLAFFWCSQSVAQPKENRVALVLGNSAYKSAPLRNPTNDAKDMAAKLKGMGFTVVERSNLSVKQIGSTLREFRSKLTPGSVALVFYAGHGVQIKGENYLPAVDADISSEEDVPTQSLAVRQIMDVLGDAKTRLNLVFLDACRNNPYARSFRSASDGLNRINAPSGTLISFATRPGSVAADGAGRNGLYTGALLEQMNNQSQPIEQVLKRVVTKVKSASNSQQEPWMEGSIEGDFCFGECGLITTSIENFIPVMSNDQREDQFWDDVRNTANKEAYEAYLLAYPNGKFINLATANLSKLNMVAIVTQPINSQSSNLSIASTDKTSNTSVNHFFSWPHDGSVAEFFDLKNNKGLKIAGKIGDSILAAADGQIVYSGSGLRGYGNLIIVKHTENYLTTYAHNRFLLVKEDQKVSKGQRIAEMGLNESGQTMLHFEIRSAGKPVDPMSLLPPK